MGVEKRCGSGGRRLRGVSDTSCTVSERSGLSRGFQAQKTTREPQVSAHWHLQEGSGTWRRWTPTQMTAPVNKHTHGCIVSEHLTYKPTGNVKNYFVIYRSVCRCTYAYRYICFGSMRSHTHTPQIYTVLVHVSCALLHHRKPIPPPPHLNRLHLYFKECQPAEFRFQNSRNPKNFLRSDWILEICFSISYPRQFMPTACP